MPLGIRTAVSSRPEGVRLERYDKFVVMNLSPLTDEQQRAAIAAQLKNCQTYAPANIIIYTCCISFLFINERISIQCLCARLSQEVHINICNSVDSTELYSRIYYLHIGTFLQYASV